MPFGFLQSNQWKCDACHIKPLIHFLKNSLMYWGSCFKEENPACLKCAKPDQYFLTPVEELQSELLPECQPQYQQVHFGIQHPNAEILGGGGFGVGGGRDSVWNTNSPYLALGLATILVLFLLAMVVHRYRHYGAYLTHEEDQLVDVDDQLARNPVVVLDKNSESYINLKYPVVLPEEDLIVHNNQTAAIADISSNGIGDYSASAAAGAVHHNGNGNGILHKS